MSKSEVASGTESNAKRLAGSGPASLTALESGRDRVDDAVLLVRRHVREERQPDEPFARAFRDGTVSGSPAPAPSHLREMQRLIMENGEDPPGLQARDQPSACFRIRQQNKEHVVTRAAAGRNRR